MKALVGAFNQEKALVGAFSVIVKTRCGTDGSICLCVLCINCKIIITCCSSVPENVKTPAIMGTVGFKFEIKCVAEGRNYRRDLGAAEPADQRGRGIAAIPGTQFAVQTYNWISFTAAVCNPVSEWRLEVTLSPGSRSCSWSETPARRPSR